MSEKKIDDGGVAFPVGFHRDGNTADQFGMSRRQWLAGLAMQGLLAHSTAGCHCTVTAKDFAKSAHDMADAMIAFEKKECR